MIEFMKSLVDTAGFPQRWYCGTAWTPELGWIHIISDALIFISYVSIPIGIFILTQDRKYIRYKLLLWLFMAFILFCGIAHLIEATIFWHPWYRLSALIKVITASVSLITSVALFSYAPKLIKFSDDLKQRNYLQYLIDSIPHPLLIIDQNFNITFLNNEFTRYTKFEYSDLMGESSMQLFPDKLKKEFIYYLKKGFLNQENVFKDFKIQNKNGVITNIEMSLVFINHLGDKEMIFSFKDLEQSIELSLVSDKLNAIFNGAVDGIIITDVYGTIQSLNKTAEEMFQYSANEIIGNNINVIVPLTYYKNNKLSQNYDINDNKGTGKIVDRVCVGLSKEGKEIPLEVSSSRIRVGNEEIYTAFLQNISDRIQMEHKIKSAYEELENFSYIAAHDLREPLRGISNYSTFLLEDYSDKLDEEGVRKLKTLQKLSQRLEKFIESLLYYSRLSKEEMVCDLVNLNELISDVLISLDISIRGQKIKIIFDKNFPDITCQKIKIREIYHNIITNAIKYNTKSMKKIEIGYLIDNKVPYNPYIFYIRDNGIGIKQEHYQLIFKMFKRLHSREQFGLGSGAGLAIVKKIIEQHNGKIWLDSKEGQGTTFYFTIGEYE